MLRALVGRSLSRHRGMILGLALVLGGFQIVLAIIAANLHREGLFVQLTAIVPPFILEALGGIRVATFSGLITLGFFHPVVMLSLSIAAIFVASELTADIEQGLVDLLAARPVPRHVLVTRSLLAAIATVATVIAVMFATNTLAARAVAPDDAGPPQLRVMAWLALNLLSVAVCFGAAALLASGWAWRRATAAGAIGLTAVFFYLLHFAAAAWAPARFIDRVSPFYYFDAMPVLRGIGTPLANILTLGTASAILVAAAYVRYQRRDL